MLVRDVRTGRLITMPDIGFGAAPVAGYRGFGSYGSGNFYGANRAPRLGHYGAASPHIIYDGLGNPLGLPFLAALAPLASSILPAIISGAAKLLPAIGSITGGRGSPSPVPPPPMPSTPEPIPPPSAPVPPSMTPAPLPPPTHEDVIAPMRVQRPDGQTVVVPVRVRRRRRMRRVRHVRLTPPIAQPLLREPRSVDSPGNLNGWVGFHGWRSY